MSAVYMLIDGVVKRYPTAMAEHNLLLHCKITMHGEPSARYNHREHSRPTWNWNNKVIL